METNKVVLKLLISIFFFIIIFLIYLILPKQDYSKTYTYVQYTKESNGKASNDFFGITNEKEYSNKEYSSHSEYINSDEWKNRSYIFKLKAEGKCYLCEKYVGISNLESHHKKYPKNFKHDSEDNLIAICRTCHAKIHGTENT